MTASAQLPQINHDPDVFTRIGNITRMLRDSLVSLGLERTIMDAAEAIPDARERLNYVVKKTSQAAERVLSCVEETRPMQDFISSEAEKLTQRWDAWFDAPVELPEARELVKDTRHYLKQAPDMACKTNNQLMDIMMAQDFQDLTGQVIQRMMTIIEIVEKELIQVLVDNIPEQVEPKKEIANSLINGPQINHTQAGVMTSQGQVDDLLQSLGF